MFPADGDEGSFLARLLVQGADSYRESSHTIYHLVKYQYLMRLSQKNQIGLMALKQ